MGEAKRRGTRDQRAEQAILRDNPAFRLRIKTIVIWVHKALREMFHG